jgi:squalene-hopene/tetraprenyl-beta-curcumene cyclase
MMTGFAETYGLDSRRRAQRGWGTGGEHRTRGCGRAGSRIALSRTCWAIAGAMVLWGSTAAAAEKETFTISAPAPNISLRNEVRRAIDKGLAWLDKSQDTNGFWSTADYPAITALGLIAHQPRAGTPEQPTEPIAVRRGYTYLLGCVQPDGGIYRKELPSYNTSVSLVALVLRNRPEYQPLIFKARNFIVGLQNLPEGGGSTNDAFVGGIGYGKADKRPDLSNTSLALEALYASQPAVKDKALPMARDLNWAAAIHFIQSCQNLPSHNPEKWASDDPQNKGGFIYAPGESKAGQTNLPSGRIALRSYGSMSYAGLLSYIYADLKPDDPRVSAVMDWLRANYTVEENPAMGFQGLYYYYHTMAKALTLYGVNTLTSRQGESINWREKLALQLINLQKADGSWANENGRWFEKDPALVTAYALIALQMICPNI